MPTLRYEVEVEVVNAPAEGNAVLAFTYAARVSLEGAIRRRLADFRITAARIRVEQVEEAA